MSSTGFPSSQIYASQNTSNAVGVPTQQPQMPIAGQLDILEKSLMQLRESIGQLQGRLGPVLNVRPQKDGSNVSEANSNSCSAVTNRLAHLWSVTNDIQQMVNAIHSDLEL